MSATITERLRTNGEWLRKAKHATQEVVDAGACMVEGADTIESLLTFAKRAAEACSFPADDFQRAMRDEARKVIAKAEGVEAGPPSGKAASTPDSRQDKRYEEPWS